MAPGWRQLGLQAPEGQKGSEDRAVAGAPPAPLPRRRVWAAEAEPVENVQRVLRCWHRGSWASWGPAARGRGTGLGTALPWASCTVVLGSFISQPVVSGEVAAFKIVARPWRSAASSV